MNFTDLVGAIRSDGERRLLSIPEGWMQGRTTYGGLTAALCLDAALPLSGGKPLRSAQVAFVGPAGGEVASTPTMLREGKNTSFISVRMNSAEGIVAEAILCFGAARDSNMNFTALPMPDVKGPETLPSFFRGGMGPAFAQHFEVLQAIGGPPLSGAPEADIGLWMRHRDRATPDDALSLLALADAPPPAAMSTMTGPARISSMTWMAEFLTDDIRTEDGWFFARHTAQNAAQGYSSQAMRLWNRAGAPVMIGRQTIAVFG